MSTMKKQVLFIQGGGAGAHDEWDNKLVDSLRRELGPGYEIRYPRMPNEADPSYPTWKAALAEEIARLDDGAILIGHSIGGTILINALAEASPNRKLAGVFLIAAPFVGAGGWPSEISSQRPTSARDCLQRRRSISITAARTTLRRLSMSIFMSEPYPARRCIGFTAAITSSTTTWPRLPLVYVL
jgi:Predicted esterase of the alpha/beta hydrolase fold